MEKIYSLHRKMINTFYFNFFFAFVFLYVNSHPQCLDYRPPFESEQPLKFCSNHSSYSCCTSLKDHDLLHNYNYVKSSFNSSVLQTCSSFFKDLLCLECHPYAAHIYDAEEIYEGERFNKRNVNFPGLCYHECIIEYIKCREFFLRIGRGAEFKKFIKNSTSHEFCLWAQIADKNYCFPNVKTINERVYEDIDGSGDITLCVKPLPHVFSNALVAVSANDGTHRLFIGEQTGLVYIVTHEGNKLEPPFLNISDRIINSGHAWDERGFLGLVFHPNYEKNGRFYVYYSSPNSMKERGNLRSVFTWEL